MGEKWFHKKIKQSSDLLSKPTHLLIQILASLSSAHRLAFYTHTLDLWKVLEAWNNPPQAAQPEQDGIIQSHNCIHFNTGQNQLQSSQRYYRNTAHVCSLGWDVRVFCI